MTQNQDPDDLPFEAGEELTVVSKVSLQDFNYIALMFLDHLAGRGAMVDS